MRILVVSDTHGKNTNLFDLLKKVKPIDFLVHCGDSDGLEDYIEEFSGCPVVMVRGNCDYACPLNADELITVPGHRIFVTHGHTYAVKSGLLNLCEKAAERGADIALYGHTHIPDLTELRGITMLNPGSLSEPRQIGRKCTYGIIDIDNDGKVYCALQAL